MYGLHSEHGSPSERLGTGSCDGEGVKTGIRAAGREPGVWGGGAQVKKFEWVHVCSHRPNPVNRMTDTSENSTFLHYVAGGKDITKLRMVGFCRF